MRRLAVVLASFDDPDALARLVGETPEEFAAAVEAENRRHAARRAADAARAEAAHLERWHKLVGDHARPAPVRWTCPQCEAVAITRETIPRCEACGFRDDA